MTPHDPFVWMDAIEQAKLVRRGEVKPSELVAAAVERIERLNKALNAVVWDRFDEAMNEARALDKLIANTAGEDAFSEKPFLGVPFLLKESTDLQGSPGTSGSRYLAGRRALVDGQPARRFKASGLVILGKTNLPEFGLLPATEPHLYGPARNPWDLSRSPGGSSGGAAVAVATGMVPVAHANDGGGSIRIPASCCGLFGLKPSRELSPGGNLLGLTVEHAVTRSVRDSAALLDVITGRFNAGDPDSFTQAVKAPLRRLRIAYSPASPLGNSVHPECAEAVARAAALLADLGHRVEEAAPRYDAERVKDTFMVLWFAGLAGKIDGLALELGRHPAPGELEPFTRAAYDAGSRIRASELLLALGYLHRFSKEFVRFFETFDLWLTPTLSSLPAPLETFAPKSGEDPLAVSERANAYVPVLPLANITGLPGMSVPLHQSREGLPVGVHFFGRANDEATLLQLAAELEATSPWADRRPPVDRLLQGGQAPGRDQVNGLDLR